MTGLRVEGWGFRMFLDLRQGDKDLLKVRNRSDMILGSHTCFIGYIASLRGLLALNPQPYGCLSKPIVSSAGILWRRPSILAKRERSRKRGSEYGIYTLNTEPRVYVGCGD